MHAAMLDGGDGSAVAGVSGMQDFVGQTRSLSSDLVGNLYDGSYRQALRARLCPLTQCDCHIGYVHMPELGLYDTFAGGVLARIPAGASGLRSELVLRPEPLLRSVPLLKSAGAAGTRPR